MPIKTKRTLLFAILCLLARSGYGYDLPPLNLGFTSFLDGGLPAGPGLYFSQYLQLYSSNDFADRNGDTNTLFPGSDPELTAWASLSQFVYASNQEVAFGGKWGVDVLIPFVALDLNFDPTGPISANSDGFGDLLIGPFLQWDPIVGENGPIFVHRLEFQLVFPTGKYDSRHTLNPGANFFSFNPYWAATAFLAPGWTSSIRFHYLWNAPNDDPVQQVPPNSPFFGANEVQAGQAIHANFTLAYELLPKKLRIGLNGYYLQQITDTEVDGHSIGGRRERVLGLGPGMIYHVSRDAHLFVNTFFETAVKNRPRGARFTFRLVYHF